LLAETLESAFEESGPSLVVVPIDYRENEILTRKLGAITSGL
jgi:acetolactate synthase-1/2/3 large subunit